MKIARWESQNFEVTHHQKTALSLLLADEFFADPEAIDLVMARSNHGREIFQDDPDRPLGPA